MSNLKRGVPIKRQKTPPSRPPAMRNPPQRPPLPGRGSGPSERTDSQLSSSSSQHNVAFIDNNDATNTENAHRRSIVLPNSPFYTPPSQDLLGLDHSLFHEIGSSLSDDTRSILTLGASSDSTDMNTQQLGSSVNSNPFQPHPQSQSQSMSATNPFATTPTPTTTSRKEGQMDLVFDDTSQQQQEGLHRSPVLTRTTSVPMGNNATVTKEGASAVKSTTASSEFDPFGSCFEEAKKDFRLTDKR